MTSMQQQHEVRSRKRTRPPHQDEEEEEEAAAAAAAAEHTHKLRDALEAWEEIGILSRRVGLFAVEQSREGCTEMQGQGKRQCRSKAGNDDRLHGKGNTVSNNNNSDSECHLSAPSESEPKTIVETNKGVSKRPWTMSQILEQFLVAHDIFQTELECLLSEAEEHENPCDEDATQSE